MKYLDVPVSGSLIYPEDIDFVVQAVKEGWFTEGKYCARFANELEKYLELKHCILCNSGSSANLLAITALKRFRNIPDGKKVITCSTGFPTTIFPIVQNNLVPVFVDADIETLNVDMQQLKHALDDPDVCGIILAHTLGFPFLAHIVSDWAKSRNVFLVEDCSDALGATLFPKKVGAFGDCMTLSFFPAHHICTGEGGAVLTNSDELATLISRFCSWGRDCHCLPGQSNSCGTQFDGDYGNLPHGYNHKYVFSEIGYNLKMTEIQGALGLAQMKHLNEFVSKRRLNFGRYSQNIHRENLINFEFLQFPSPFGFPLVLKSEYSARSLEIILKERGIHTRPIFSGNIIRHPVIDRFSMYEIFDSLMGSDYLTNFALWVGLHPALSENQIDHVIESINEFI